MADTLRLLVQRAAELAGPVLVPPAAALALHGAPTELDGHISWAMLECRLTDDPRVDLIAHVGRSACHGAVRVADWPLLEGLLSKWSDPSSPLHDIVTLTVEFDHREGQWRPPIVFLALEAATGGPPLNQLEQRMRAGLVSGGETSWPAALARAMVEMPPAGWPVHLATLRPRGRADTRLVVSIPPSAVCSYLERIGWPGDPEFAGRLAVRVGRTLPRISVHLDAGEAFGPELGVEVSYPGRPDNDARWEPTFDLLEPMSPVKVAALRRWPSREGPLLRLLGIKFAVSANAVRGAKAYLAFRSIPPGA